MLPVKRWPVVMKDELELLASNELHTAEAGAIVYHNSSHSEVGTKGRHVAE